MKKKEEKLRDKVKIIISYLPYSLVCVDLLGRCLRRQKDIDYET